MTSFINRDEGITDRVESAAQPWMQRWGTLHSTQAHPPMKVVVVAARIAVEHIFNVCGAVEQAVRNIKGRR